MLELNQITVCMILSEILAMCTLILSLEIWLLNDLLLSANWLLSLFRILCSREEPKKILGKQKNLGNILRWFYFISASLDVKLPYSTRIYWWFKHKELTVLQATLLYGICSSSLTLSGAPDTLNLHHWIQMVEL